MGLPSEIRLLNRRISAESLVRHMRRDKKVRDGALRFVLVRGIGQAFTSDAVPAETVTGLLREEGCTE
jgi:shikimate kinase/3-dehydroquinate synthase